MSNEERENELFERIFELEAEIQELNDIAKDQEIERLNNIINETRRILGEYKHFSTPTEEQNSENEEIIDKAYIKLHSNLQELKGDGSNA